MYSTNFLSGLLKNKNKNVTSFQKNAWYKSTCTINTEEAQLRSSLNEKVNTSRTCIIALLSPVFPKGNTVIYHLQNHTN